jgi:integrase
VPLQERLGLSVPLTFQVLRRSHATRNQQRLKDVQSHLGHKSIKTTGDIYVQEIPASVREMLMLASDEADVLSLYQK